MIVIEDLCFGYEKNDESVLRGIGLEIEEGAYIAIIGPNGCGKTTLGKQLNGLLVPSKGSVRVDGMDTRDSRTLKDIRQRVGMVFQNPDDQIVGMTVEEDVAFGPGNLRMPPEAIREQVKKSLETVGMNRHAAREPQALSNGEKQLVAIAGVLAMDPGYIILDEPTTYLDPLGKKKVLGVIRALNHRGISVVHITHSMAEAAQAERIVVMNQGEIRISGEPQMVFSQRGLLNELGLDIPLITQLMWRIKELGADVNPYALSLDEALEELAPFFQKAPTRKGARGHV